MPLLTSAAYSYSFDFRLLTIQFVALFIVRTPFLLKEVVSSHGYV